jgi:hypothetical protein
MWKVIKVNGSNEKSPVCFLEIEGIFGFVTWDFSLDPFYTAPLVGQHTYGLTLELLFLLC